MAAHRQQSRRCDINRVSAERYSLYDVRAASDRTADNDGNIVSDTLVAEPLVNACERKLYRNAYVIADTCRSRAGAASVAVDGDDVRAASRDTGSDSRNVMYRRYLYDDRLLPVGGFLQRENKLAEILDGIDIVVRSRGNSVSALGYHTGPGYFFVYLHTREVSADTRLSTLTHLYLDSGAGVEVLLEHAETSGSYLAYRVGAVLVEILVQTAFAGVVVGSQLLSRSRKGLMRVLRNGAE